MVNDGQSLEHALVRAAREHGTDLRHHGPTREELYRAVNEYRALFRPDQLTVLDTQRRLALQAMRSLTDFEPRLVGGLVHGAGRLDCIRLLLSADSPEQVLMQLQDRRIPWEASEVTLRYAGNRRRECPAVRFMAGDTRVEAVILDRRSPSDPPRDSIDGGPLETMNPAQLEALIGL